MTVLDDLSTGSLARLPEHKNLSFIQGDILDPAAVRRALAGVDVVFHHAAIASVERSVADPAGSLAVGVVGTARLLEGARSAGVRRFVFASSSAVYGDDPSDPKRESGPTVPRSPYAVGKLAGELLFASAQALYGIEAVCLRYFNVYGPGQDPDGAYAAVVPRFVQAALRGLPATLYGDGGQTRDFCFVGDVVEANLRAATVSGVAGSVFNIGTGAATSVSALHEAVCDAVRAVSGRSPLLPIRETARMGDVRHSVCDPGRAAAALSWRAETSLSDGILQTVRAAAEVGSS